MFELETGAGCREAQSGTCYPHIVCLKVASVVLHFVHDDERQKYAEEWT